MSRCIICENQNLIIEYLEVLSHFFISFIYEANKIKAVKSLILNFDWNYCINGCSDNHMFGFISCQAINKIICILFLPIVWLWHCRMNIIFIYKYYHFLLLN
jgi:hypothetical protein